MPSPPRANCTNWIDGREQAAHEDFMELDWKVAIAKRAEGPRKHG
jgi:hypothetical protein